MTHGTKSALHDKSSTEEALRSVLCQTVNRVLHITSCVFGTESLDRKASCRERVF